MKTEPAVGDMDISASEKLRNALEPFCFGGTECHGVVNVELRGPENEIAASNIRHAIVAQYHDTVPLDAMIEIIGKLFDDGELAREQRAERLPPAIGA